MPKKPSEQRRGDATDGTQSKQQPSPTSTVSLNDLQERARRHGADADSPGRMTKRARRRPAPWRILMWCVELAVLLALVELFLRNQRRTPEPPSADPAPSPWYAGGETMPPLGERARELPGLSAVAPQVLAPLEGLAQGSETMRRTQADFSTESRLPIDVVNSIGMRFRLVPPGTAVIGSPQNEPGRGDGESQHVVTIPKPFYLASCEVTQQQWTTIMSENPSGFSGDQRPVEEVTWYDCQRFVNALCEQETLPRGSYRLPTEAEWEYACRAGTATAYCGGDAPTTLDPLAEYAGNNYEATRPVAGKRPNALGLFNMHGNVWEWCQDRFAPYPGGTVPTKTEDHSQWRCIRGGNWYVPALDCRSAERGRLPPRSHGNMLGFRVLRTIP